MKKIVSLTLVAIFATGVSFGQKLIDEKKLRSNQDELTETVCDDMDLSPIQQTQMKDLKKRWRAEIGSIEEEYKLNSEVYLNKMRLINERYVGKIRTVLSLEQYAIYLNNNRDNQYYDTDYEKADMKLIRQADGDVYFCDAIGEIKITDRVFKVKNKVRDSKLRVTDNKIVFKDDMNDRKVKIKEDKLIVKNDGDKEIIETDEVDFEDDTALIEIEIDLVEQ